MIVLYQVRWHGRGGQGAVTAAKIFGMAASLQGDYFAQSFPAFGAERRGAPVQAFTKIDSGPILDRGQIYEPDAVVVLDPGLLQSIDVTAGLKPGGQLVINCARFPIGRLPLGKFDCTAVNATDIALEILGKSIANTAMAGALCAVLNFVALASIKRAIAETLPTHLAATNSKAAEAAYYKVISGKKGAQVA
jgi:2-oxoacid:acceptor oxidoreductase gamma subunit (pyruvate/2-ketoisovalerate family)